MLLDNKVAIVSGVGPGMGQATAKALAREGAAVALAARSEGFLKETAEEIRASGGSALPVPTDLVDPEQCQNLVDRTVEEFGGIDVLVNAAFKPDVFRRFDEVDLNEWRSIFDVNVWGSLQLTQAAVPHLKSRGGGSIVFVNTMEVRKPRQRLGGYASSKGALHAAMFHLAKSTTGRSATACRPRRSSRRSRPTSRSVRSRDRRTAPKPWCSSRRTSRAPPPVRPST